MSNGVKGVEVVDEGLPILSGGSFLPPADNLYDLGSVAFSWRNLHVQTAVYATSVVGSWSPSDDDTYWLGTATLGWKGLHMPDTLITDESGHVLLRNNANNAYVGLKVGAAEFNGIATFKSDVVNEGYLGLLVTDTDGATEGEIWYDASENTLKVCTGSVDSVVLLAATQSLTNKTLDAAVAKGTWTADGTWQLPAVTLGGAVSAGASGRLNLSGATLDVADNDISLISIGSYDTALASTTKPTANTFVTSLNVSQSIDADSDIWFAGAYIKLTPITNAQTHNSFVTSMTRMDIAVVVDSAYGLQSHVKFSGTGAVAADGEVVGLSGQIYGAVNTSQGLFWAVKGDLRATGIPAGSGESAAGFFVTTVSAGEIVRCENLSGATVQNGLLIQNAGTMIDGIDLVGTMTNGINLANAALTVDIVFQNGATLVDDGTSLTLAGANFVATLGAITMADTVGINTGVVNDDYFTIGAVDNDTNTITELVRFVGAAAPYLTIGAPTTYKVKFDPTIAGITFGDGTDSWDISLKIYDVNTMGIYNAVGDVTRGLRIADLELRGSLNFSYGSPYITAPNINAAYLTLKARDTDAGVIEVARLAGAADPYFSMGGSQEFKFYNSGTALLGGTVNLGDIGIQLNESLGTDNHFSGMTRAGVAGCTTNFGDILYLATADDRWELAQADDATTHGGNSMLAINVTTAEKGDGEAFVVLLIGFVRDDTAYEFVDGGTPVYLSAATAGLITATPPAANGNIVRIVGYADDDKETIFFNPNATWVEVVV